MWQEVSKVTAKISVLRRLLFAIASVPEGTPNRWEVICQFSFENLKDKATVEDVKLLAENIEFLDAQAFVTDSTLAKELISAEGLKKGSPMGIVMISSNSVCKECGGALVIQEDRPRSSSIVLYTESMGILYQPHTTSSIVPMLEGDAGFHSIMATTPKVIQTSAITTRTGTLYLTSNLLAKQPLT